MDIHCMSVGMVKKKPGGGRLTVGEGRWETTNSIKMFMAD